MLAAVDNKKVFLTVCMSTLTYWSFYFLFFCVRFLLCGANRLYVRLSLSQDFEQFGSLYMYMCAPRKDIGRRGIRTRYPRALSQPRYQ